MMATPTQRNRFEKQSTGANVNTWGSAHLNVTLDLIDQSLDGVLQISTSSGTVTLSANDYSSDQSRNRIIHASGALSGDVTIVVPNVQKWYWVRNSTTGGHDVKVKTASGSSVTMPRSSTAAIYCDGSDGIHFLAGWSGAMERVVTLTGTLSLSETNLGDLVVGSGTINLPAPSSIGAGWWFTAKANGGPVSIVGSIDGASSASLSANASVRLTCDGTKYISTFATSGYSA